MKFGTRSLAQAVTESPSVRRLVFISSIGAVGVSSEGTVDDASRVAPSSEYGMSKLKAERHIVEILQGGDADWCILRPTLVFGRGNPGNMARLVALVDSGIPLPLASVRNERSFLYVRNLVDLVERCLQSHAASRQTFVVADEPPLSTPALVRAIAKCRGVRVASFLSRWHG